MSGQRTSDFYRTKNIPERFDNPGKAICSMHLSKNLIEGRSWPFKMKIIFIQDN